MRVGLVNTCHYPGGGDATYTLNLAQLLRARGHRVAFFAMHDERNLPDENSDLFVRHVDFRELNRRKNLFSGLQVLWRAMYSVEARAKFRRLVARFTPDIVHLQNIHAHITPSIVFEAKKHAIPVVWTLHDYKLICPNSHFVIDDSGEICEACAKGAYYRAMLKRCKKGSLLASTMASIEAYGHRFMRVQDRVDRFLCPSVFLRCKLLERGFPSGKTVHIPHFLSDEFFQVTGANDGYFLFAGKLEGIKGIYPLLEACHKAPKVQLLLAGRIERSLTKRLRNLLPSNASYLGVKEGDELHSVLRGALAVVVPSLWYENQPFTILEAFASAKPVIASDLGGMTELVKDGERGLLVPAGDAEALAETMQWTKDHPQKAREMGMRAYEYARGHHSSQRHYTELMKIYTQFAGGN